MIGLPGAPWFSDPFLCDQLPLGMKPHTATQGGQMPECNHGAEGNSPANSEVKSTLGAREPTALTTVAKLLENPGLPGLCWGMVAR